MPIEQKEKPRISNQVTCYQSYGRFCDETCTAYSKNPLDIKDEVGRVILETHCLNLYHDNLRVKSNQQQTEALEQIAETQKKTYNNKYRN